MSGIRTKENHAIDHGFLSLSESDMTQRNKINQGARSGIASSD